MSDDLEVLAGGLDRVMERARGLDPEARHVFDDAKGALDRLHRDGLTTIVRRLREDERGRELLYELVDDPGVRMILGMHGIIRTEPPAEATESSAASSGGGCCGGGSGEPSATVIPLDAVRLRPGAARMGAPLGEE